MEAGPTGVICPDAPHEEFPQTVRSRVYVFDHAQQQAPCGAAIVGLGTAVQVVAVGTKFDARVGGKESALVDCNGRDNVITLG